MQGANVVVGAVLAGLLAVGHSLGCIVHGEVALADARQVYQTAFVDDGTANIAALQRAYVFFEAAQVYAQFPNAVVNIVGAPQLGGND